MRETGVREDPMVKALGNGGPGKLGDGAESSQLSRNELDQDYSGVEAVGSEGKKELEEQMIADANQYMSNTSHLREGGENVDDDADFPGNADNRPSFGRVQAAQNQNRRPPPVAAALARHFGKAKGNK